MTTDREQILDEMIQWWISRKSEASPKGRIKFDRSDTVQATIRIPKKMYTDAMSIAYADPNIKNFSRFCEMLIWEYLRKDSKYLKNSTVTDNQKSLELTPQDDGD